MGTKKISMQNVSFLTHRENLVMARNTNDQIFYRILVGSNFLPELLLAIFMTIKCRAISTIINYGFYNPLHFGSLSDKFLYIERSIQAGSEVWIDFVG